MHPRLYCYLPQSKSNTSQLIFEEFKNLFSVIKSETQALLTPNAIIVDFINSAKEEEILDVYKRRKLVYPNNPIVIIGPSINVVTKFNLYRLGLDNYLSYNFEIEAICNQIQIISQNWWQQQNDSDGKLQFSNLELDLATRQIRRGSRKIKLRNKEFDLLKFLTENKNKVVPTEELLEQVWGYSYQAVTNTVQVHIASLRKKLNKGFKKELIHTLPKQGYLLSEQAI